MEKDRSRAPAPVLKTPGTCLEPVPSLGPGCGGCRGSSATGTSGAVAVDVRCWGLTYFCPCAHIFLSFPSPKASYDMQCWALGDGSSLQRGKEPGRMWPLQKGRWFAASPSCSICVHLGQPSTAFTPASTSCLTARTRMH